MSREQLSAINELPASAGTDILSVVAEVITTALLLFMPAAFGVVAPWSETIVALGTLALTLIVTAKLISRRDTANVWTWSFVPVCLFVLLGALQLLWLPANWIARISPATAATKRRLLADLLTGNPILGRMTLSFYPPGTRHDLGIVLIAVAFFLTALVIYRRPAAIKRLLTTIAVIGGAAALLALMQDLSAADKIYWSIPSLVGRATAGPFVLYNNFAQFMNLSIGAALGLLLVDLREFQDERRRDSDRSPLRLSTWGPTLWHAGFRRVPLLAAVIVLGLISIFLCLSRGGMISALIAGAIACVFIARQRRASAQAWALVLLLTLAFGGLLYFGFDAVCDRLATLYNRPDPSSGRFQVYKDLAGVYQRFWTGGTGLGTHQYVYPMFDRSSDPLLSEQADSDWFQLASEMGTAGLLLVSLFCGVIAYHCRRAILASRPRICLAAIGLAYGLLAVVLHSFTDFGQHLPAIAALSAVSCGVLINLSRFATFEPASKRHRNSPQVDVQAAVTRTPQFGWVARPATVVVAILVMFGSAWTAQVLNRTRVSAAHADRAADLAADLVQNGQSANPSNWTQVLAEAAAARDLVPDGVNYRYALDSYQWQMIASQPGPAAPTKWAPASIDAVRQIVKDLHAARVLCPTYGPTLAVAGQLELTILGEPEIGNAHIQAGYALAPANPTVCFAAALADAQGGRWDAATAKFRRTLQLDLSMFQQITGDLINRLHRPDLAIAIARDKPEWLLSLASQLRQQPPPGVNPLSYSKALADALLDLKAHGIPDDSPPWILHQMSQVCEEQQDLSGAIDYEKRAITLEYANVWFHLRLAQLCEKQGKTMEAVDQARMCLRLQPALAPARQMLGELALRPDFIPGE